MTNPRDPKRRYGTYSFPERHTEDRALQLVDEANALGALSDPSIFALLETLTATPWDKDLIALAENALQSYRIRQVVAPDPFRPYPGPLSGLDQGEIDVGVIRETNLQWRVPLRDFPFWAIIGPTRKGKTNLIYCILEALAGRIPYVFVTIKPDTHRLLVDPPIAHYAVCFEELKLSLFEPPPGIDEEVWHRDIIDLVCRTFGLQYSRALLLESCERLRNLYATYSKQQGATVRFTLRALYEMVARSRSKYFEGAAAALQMLCDTTGDVFECSQGMPPLNLLLRGSLVLMIQRIKYEKSARFVVDWLIAWIYSWLDAHGPNDGSPQCVIVLDDAQRFLSQAAERDGLMPLSHFYLVAGQSGVRIVAASQVPMDLAPAVLSQSGIITQVGGLTHGKDLTTTAAAFGLPLSCVNRLQEPGRGEFIARETLGRYGKPFAGMIRAFPPQSMAFSEADRQRLMAPLLAAMPWKPAVPLGVAEHAVGGSSCGAVPARLPSAVSANAMTLAADILVHPWDFLNARYNRLNLAGRPGQQAKDELLRLKWVREHKIPKHGRAPILLEPLLPLATAVGKPLPSYSKGGYLHAFASQAVMARLRTLGYSGIRKETFFGTKAVDVVATDPTGRLVGIEVSISLTNLVDNLEKDLLVQPNFASLVAVCLDSAAVRQAQRAIALAPGLKAYFPRIRVEPLAAWM